MRNGIAYALATRQSLFWGYHNGAAIKPLALDRRDHRLPRRASDYREIPYVVQVKSTTSRLPERPSASGLPTQGMGRPPIRALPRPRARR